jgi:hypothetical protein
VAAVVTAGDGAVAPWAVGAGAVEASAAVVVVAGVVDEVSAVAVVVGASAAGAGAGASGSLEARRRHEWAIDCPMNRSTIAP